MRRRPTFERLELRHLLSADVATTECVAAQLPLSTSALGSIRGQVIAFSSRDFAAADQWQPLAGAVVELLSEDGHVMETASTTGDGSYEFVGLPPGLFGVRQIPPTSYSDGRARAGDAGGSVLSRNLIADIAIDTGTLSEGYDFWVVPSGLDVGESPQVFPTGDLTPSCGVLNIIALATAQPTATSQSTGLRDRDSAVIASPPTSFSTRVDLNVLLASDESFAEGEPADTGFRGSQLEAEDQVGDATLEQEGLEETLNDPIDEKVGSNTEARMNSAKDDESTPSAIEAPRHVEESAVADHGAPEGGTLKPAVADQQSAHTAAEDGATTCARESSSDDDASDPNNRSRGNQESTNQRV